jgi:hypothetical protein
MLFREIIAVYYESREKPINTLWWKNTVPLVSVKMVHTYTTVPIFNKLVLEKSILDFDFLTLEYKIQFCTFIIIID